MKKKVKLLAWILSLFIVITGCQTKQKEEKSKDIAKMTFEEIKKEASGKTVKFYGWGGDDNLNKWLDEYFKVRLKEKYNITLERVPMNIEEILGQLNQDKAASKKEGPIDMIWINGENFKTAKENKLLFGPFLEKLPNFEKYVDKNDVEVKTDFSFPIEGYEAPYGKAQFVMYYDEAKTNNAFTDLNSFSEFVKNNKGKVTYPALPDFTGSAFVRNVIYELVSPDVFKDLKADKKLVKEKIQPALDYLKSINKYLWNEGKSFPKTSTQLENMYSDGEVVMGMTYAAYGPQVEMAKGKFPKTTKTIQFDKGTIGNTNYIAIAENSTSKAAAMVAINEMMDAEVQANRFEKLLTLPIIDNNKLDEKQKEMFNKIKIGDGAIPQAELLKKRLPEMPAGLVPIIEELWQEEVLGK